MILLTCYISKESYYFYIIAFTWCSIIVIDRSRCYQKKVNFETPNTILSLTVYRIGTGYAESLCGSTAKILI